MPGSLLAQCPGLSVLGPRQHFVTGPDKAAEREGLGVFSENLAITIRNLNIVTSAHCSISNFFREVKCRQTVVFLFLSKVFLMKKFDH